MTTLGSNNLLGIILNKENDLYTISTRQGAIESLYTRNQFEVCPKNILQMDEVPSNTISQCNACGTLRSSQPIIVIASVAKTQGVLVEDHKNNAIQSVIMGEPVKTKSSNSLTVIE